MRPPKWASTGRGVRRLHASRVAARISRREPKSISSSTSPSSGTRLTQAQIPRKRFEHDKSTDVARADALFKARKLPLLGAGVAAMGLGLYCSIMISSFMQESLPSDDILPTGRPPAFTREAARHFDKSLDASEQTSGIVSLRQRLGRQASGHVLEVAIGTGRNLSYYDWTRIIPSNPPTTGDLNSKTTPGTNAAMLSFTGVDVSADMLSVAFEKLACLSPTLALKPHALATSTISGDLFTYLDGKVRILQCDIQDVLPGPKQGVSSTQKYDTVIQTFGLCSVSSPEQVIRNLAGSVRPGSGRIILVEHGRSWLGVVNTLLDWSALSHFKKYGCWWNRDIVTIIHKAAETIPGLKIETIERPYITQLGTTVWIELSMEERD